MFSAAFSSVIFTALVFFSHLTAIVLSFTAAIIISAEQITVTTQKHKRNDYHNPNPRIRAALIAASSK
jgi:hypothetical protein